ncbi:hypothetical protein HMPREF1345_01497 [Enterococcus faecium TX1337RF]|nr:hypothetical protein HMPREF1345_01497 [Enterococcus faecium TX1337RF]
MNKKTNRKGAVIKIFFLLEIKWFFHSFFRCYELLRSAILFTLRKREAGET